MTVKYPRRMNIKFSDEDMTSLNEMAHSVHMTPSALLRRALREWSQKQLTEER